MNKGKKYENKVSIFKKIFRQIKAIFRSNKIIKERLPVGLIALIGRQGVGKSSCGHAMLANDYKYHGQERFNECNDYVKTLNKEGYNLHLAKNKVIYFCSDESFLDCKKGIKTWYIDPAKFKLPSGEEDDYVQYVPRGSVVFLPEFDNVVGCRDWKTMSPYLIALAKYARHFDLTIIIDFQVWLQLDASWRRLMMYTNFIYESYFSSRFLWFKKRRCWHSVWVDNQLNNFIKDLRSMSAPNGLLDKLQKQTITMKDYYFKGNIFNLYDSFSGASFFLRGIKDYEFIPHERIILSPSGVEAYCKRHPITRPDEAKRKDRRTK